MPEEYRTCSVANSMHDQLCLLSPNALLLRQILKIYQEKYELNTNPTGEDQHPNVTVAEKILAIKDYSPEVYHDLAKLSALFLILDKRMIHLHASELLLHIRILQYLSIPVIVGFGLETTSNVPELGVVLHIGLALIALLLRENYDFKKQVQKELSIAYQAVEKPGTRIKYPQPKNS